MDGDENLSADTKSRVARVHLFGVQSAYHHRLRRLPLERGRPPDARQEGSEAAGFAILQSAAAVTISGCREDDAGDLGRVEIRALPGFAGIIAGIEIAAAAAGIEASSFIDRQRL